MKLVRDDFKNGLLEKQIDYILLMQKEIGIYVKSTERLACDNHILKQENKQLKEKIKRIEHWYGLCQENVPHPFDLEMCNILYDRPETKEGES